MKENNKRRKEILKGRKKNRKRYVPLENKDKQKRKPGRRASK